VTVHSQILKVLEDADKPLTGAEVAEQVDARRTSVYSKLKRMAEKGKVFRDENMEGGYSVMYQLRQRRVRSSNKKQETV